MVSLACWSLHELAWSRAGTCIALCSLFHVTRPWVSLLCVDTAHVFDLCGEHRVCWASPFVVFLGCVQLLTVFRCCCHEQLCTCFLGVSSLRWGFWNQSAWTVVDFYHILSLLYPCETWHHSRSLHPTQQPTVILSGRSRGKKRLWSQTGQGSCMLLLCCVTLGTWLNHFWAWGCSPIIL